MPPCSEMPTLTQKSRKCLTRNGSPISVGTGFVALDMLLEGNTRVRADELYAGGSCGNVLSILAHFSWNSNPVARLAYDNNAEELLADFRRTGVNTQFVYQAETAVTPVIIIRLATRPDGTVRPHFEWKDPSSGAWLPRYRPFPKTKAAEVAPQLPSAGVFYFDRVEASALLMAKAMRDKGAVVFFEPSSCKHDDLFTECLAVSDIVKYSEERISRIPCTPAAKSPRLEIQTRGQAGLRYRLKMGTTKPGEWETLPAFEIDEYVDSTGCGDWCSAGIIDKLCHKGRKHFLSLGEDAIVEGLWYGLALAAVNCQYRGARGPMYHLTSEKLSASIDSILSSRVS